MGIDFTVFKGSSSGEVVEAKGHREVGPTEALIDLTHSGVCGTDEHYLRAGQGLGHEGVGIIRELGPQTSLISDLKVGDRVAMGWIQKVCGYCESCMTGRQFGCHNLVQFGTGNHDEGCFGTGIAWDVSTLVKVPDAMESKFAGPMVCGGATVWGPLYQHGLRAGDRIGILGIGGLGHLGIQIASKMGMEVVVFSSTDSKREEAIKFGAAEFVATKGVRQFEGIKPLDALLVTTSVLPDFNLYMPILKPFAKVFPLTISMEPASISMLALIMKSISIIGSAGAHLQSMKTMMEFAAKHGVRPQIEEFPMSQKGVTDAMAKLRDGKMRYRGVVVVDQAN